MGNNTKSTVKTKPHDYTVYKVCAAFVMMVLSMLTVQRVLNIYAVGSTFDVVYGASQVCWKLCAVLCVVCVAAFLLLRGKRFRNVFAYVFVLSALAGLSALDLRYFWTEHATAIYMAHAAVYCLYIIFSLYGSEFFCFSLATILLRWCWQLLRCLQTARQRIRAESIWRKKRCNSSRCALTRRFFTWRALFWRAA